MSTSREKIAVGWKIVRCVTPLCWFVVVAVGDDGWTTWLIDNSNVNSDATKAKHPRRPIHGPRSTLPRSHSRCLTLWASEGSSNQGLTHWGFRFRLGLEWLQHGRWRKAHVSCSEKVGLLLDSQSYACQSNLASTIIWAKLNDEKICRPICWTIYG